MEPNKYIGRWVIYPHEIKKLYCLKCKIVISVNVSGEVASCSYCHLLLFNAISCYKLIESQN
jgi:hypothetical protein